MQLFENGPAFQACERSAETMVDTAYERQMGALAAADIQTVGILEDVRVPVDRAEKRDEALSEKTGLSRKASSSSPR